MNQNTRTNLDDLSTIANGYHTLEDMCLTEDHIEACISLFKIFCGIDCNSPVALHKAAEVDVRGDVELALALGCELEDFLDWFGSQDVSYYEMTLAMGGSGSWKINAMAVVWQLLGLPVAVQKTLKHPTTSGALPV
jgi:hypothetical protein